MQMLTVKYWTEVRDPYGGFGGKIEGIEGDRVYCMGQNCIFN